MRRWIAVTAALLSAGPALAADTIKVAYIDPLTGPFANVGDQGVKHFQGVMDRINASGGVLGGKKFELVPIDNKGTPQDSLLALNAAIDQGIRIVTQGNGSGSANALMDAIAKHNARNPDQAVVFLNYAAVDPDLTNSKCNFWHFRFDANTHQKMEVMTNYLAKQKDVRKVYLINQDYQHGHQVVKYATEMLAKKRPDIQVVGSDLHPIGKVKDFSPYVAKVKQSGADAIITGNWGADLALLVKAAKDADLKARFYTYYGGGLGTPTAVGTAGADRLIQVTEYHTNMVPNRAIQYATDFKKKYNIDYYYERISTEMAMLARAIEQAKSSDPKSIALALEGMKYDAEAGEVWMRKQDHQLIMPLYISIFEKVDGKSIKYDVEGTGYGFRTVAVTPASETDVPTTCKMERP